MSENSTLRIHTQLGPAVPPADAPKPKRKSRLRAGARGASGHRRLAFGDRLLRNSAIACALLLGMLALGNVRQPWAEKAAGRVRQALTMRIDLDDAIGDLTFVRRIMPESALVFLNVSGGAAMWSSSQLSGMSPDISNFFPDALARPAAHCSS